MLRENSEGKFAFLHDHGAWGQCSSACGEYEVRRRREPADPDGVQIVEALYCEEHCIIHDLYSPDLHDNEDKPRRVGLLPPVQTVCYESCRSDLIPVTMELRYCETQAYKDEMKEEADENDT
jgi:hypothetical protein